MFKQIKEQTTKVLLLCNLHTVHCCDGIDKHSVFFNCMLGNFSSADFFFQN